MILKVTVTKEHLRQAMYCNKKDESILTNCAIAVAVREVFPDAEVYIGRYAPFHNHTKYRASHNGAHFISKFDNSTPTQRLELPEIEVELEITDEIIEEATKHLDFKEIVNNTPHLELIEQ